MLEYSLMTEELPGMTALISVIASCVLVMYAEVV